MIYAISDIHGCMGTLEEVMTRVKLSGLNRLVFLGDYIDYGNQSGQVLQYIRELQQKYGVGKVIVLKGNHEAALLEWFKEFSRKRPTVSDALSYNSWLKTDSEQGYKTLRTLITDEQMKELSVKERTASFNEINMLAAKLLRDSCRDLIDWMRKMPLYYETENQIFVHAGVNEKAGDLWKTGTTTDTFLWKFPATKGKFIKPVIAGHIGVSQVAENSEFEDIYFDGGSHYYIDGPCVKAGKLLLLGFDEKTGKYYQVEKDVQKEVECYVQIPKL